MKLTTILILMFLSINVVLADEIAEIFANSQDIPTKKNCSIDNPSPLKYLNCLRKLAGLIPLSTDYILLNTAQNHAKYLNTNNQYGHNEDIGYIGYTGNKPNQRAAYEGYKTAIAENVSTHTMGTYIESIDHLLSAIYHRFGFLNINMDVIGISDNQDLLENPHTFVYNMANSALNLLCNGQSFSGYGKYWLACINKQGDPDHNYRVEGGKYKIANEYNAKSNIDVIIWPPQNSIDIPPVFTKETPDPLPNYDVSGYPISIEFNHIKHKKPPKIITFKLTRVKDQKKLEAIILMNSENDPNSKFTKFQNAFFPLQRLDWATEYEVYIAYADGILKRKTWRFTTKDLGVKIYTITENKQIDDIEQGKTFALYFPPSNGFDFDSSYNSSYDSRIKMTIDIIDGNTLKVKMHGKGKAKIHSHNKTIHFSL